MINTVKNVLKIADGGKNLEIICEEEAFEVMRDETGYAINKDKKVEGGSNTVACGTPLLTCSKSQDVLTGNELKGCRESSATETSEFSLKKSFGRETELKTFLKSK